MSDQDFEELKRQVAELSSFRLESLQTQRQLAAQLAEIQARLTASEGKLAASERKGEELQERVELNEARVDRLESLSEPLRLAVFRAAMAVLYRQARVAALTPADRKKVETELVTSATTEFPSAFAPSSWPTGLRRWFDDAFGGPSPTAFDVITASRNGAVHTLWPGLLKQAIQLGPVAPLSAAGLEGVAEGFPFLFGLEFSEVSQSGWSLERGSLSLVLKADELGVSLCR